MNGSTISGFCINATGTNTSQNLCNNTGTTLSFNTTGIYNITAYNISGGSYYNVTQHNYNFSDTATLTLSTYQAVLTITAKQLWTNNSIQTFNITNNLATNTTTNGSLTIPANNGSQSLNITVPGNYSINQSCTATSLTTTSCIITGIYDAVYHFNASNTHNNSRIDSFNLVINNSNISSSPVINTSTTNGSLNLSILQGYTYLVQFSTPNATHEYKNATITSSAANQYYQFNVSPSPSINVTIRDASTGSLITQNITLLLAGNTTGQTNYTVTGGAFYASIPIGDYTIKLSNANYSQAQYALTATEGTVYHLTAYLQSNATETVIMQYVDSISSSIVIPDALVTQYRLVNGSWVLISSKNTDITGRTSFGYLENEAYRFISSATGYTTKEYELDPVLFSSYTVKMTRTNSMTTGQDYQNIYINYEPKAFYSNTQNNITLTYQSPDGLLTNYTYNLTWPGGSNTGSGTTPAGEILDLNVTIGNASINDRVNITITYTTSISGTRTFTGSHIIIPASSDTLWVNNPNGTYGLGLIERALVGTIIIIIAAGVITMAIGSLPGLLMALMIMGVLIKIGFWEWWLAGISLIIGIAIISKRAA